MKNPVIRSNRIQCLFALVSAVIVAVCVCIGVTMNLVTLFDENFDQMGLRTFCMFTVDSNILAGLTMLLCVPYTIDGIRTGYYHLPDWVVVWMYIAVTAVCLTFLVSLFILAPVKGFVLIFSGSRFFLHGVCPVLSILTFCCFINSHLIRLRETILAMIPVFLYTAVYIVMVLFIGEEHGGWSDFYGFVTRVPAWVSLLVILPLCFGITLLLRQGHNTCCLRRRKKDAELYRSFCAGSNLREVIEKMARSIKMDIKTKSIFIPTQIIALMIQNSDDDIDHDDACRCYLEAFLKES